MADLLAFSAICIIQIMFSYITTLHNLPILYGLSVHINVRTRGLQKILVKNQYLLDYWPKKNRVRYKKLISQLGIWESKTYYF